MENKASFGSYARCHVKTRKPSIMGLVGLIEVRKNGVLYGKFENTITSDGKKKTVQGAATGSMNAVNCMYIHTTAAYET